MGIIDFYILMKFYILVGYLNFLRGQTSYFCINQARFMCIVQMNMRFIR